MSLGPLTVVIVAIHLQDMPFTTRSTVAMSSTAIRVTPTDELEQATFQACDDISPQATFHQEQHCHDDQLQQWQCSMTALESMIDVTLLPHNSFYSPAAATAASFAEPLPRPVVVSEYHDHHLHEHDRDESASSRSGNDAHPDVLQAAGILCHFKNEVIRDCSDAHIVDLAVKMLTEDEEILNDAASSILDNVQNFLPIDEEHEEARVGTTIASSLQRPDRLAIDLDAQEVNKLHQYVRKELLEVFVVPRDSVSSSDTSDDDEEDDDNSSEDDDKEDDEHKSYAKDVKVIKRALNSMRRCACTNTTSSSSNTSTTRHLVTRRRSITVSTVPSSSTTAAQRYYPGRVGLRCAHCAHVRRKSTSKAAFYPLRIKNIYREVCAWQRIHFKNCKYVPHTVRQRYDHYKRIDPSRGKVKYWESSARKIGLENNPSR